MKTKRIILFLFGCIGIRILLTIITKNINPVYLPYFGYVALLISSSFIYLYFFGNKIADNQLEWLEEGDKTIWWNELRIVHGLLYLLFAIYAIQGKEWAWIPLSVDVSIGLSSWLIHHKILV